MPDLPGGFGVMQIQHYGVSARCCYEKTKIRLEKQKRIDDMTLYIFGDLEGKDRYMCNMCEVSMSMDQVQALYDALGQCLKKEGP